MLKSSSSTATVGCPVGTRVIAGGFSTSVAPGSSALPVYMQIDSSFFDASTLLWTVRATNAASGGGNRSLVLTPYAVCATVQ